MKWTFLGHENMGKILILSSLQININRVKCYIKMVPMGLMFLIFVMVKLGG